MPGYLANAKGADARRETEKELADCLGAALNPATVLREFLKTGSPSMRGVIGVYRRSSAADSLGGAIDTATVLREFLKSSKGSDARNKTAKGLARPLGGALDCGPVLRESLERSEF